MRWPSIDFRHAVGEHHDNERTKTPDGVENPSEIIAAGSGERIDGVADGCGSRKVLSFDSIDYFGVAIHGS